VQDVVVLLFNTDSKMFCYRHICYKPVGDWFARC